MDLIKYTDSHKQKCIEIFLSNCPKYFAEWEYEKFDYFLLNYAASEPFFVLIINDNLIGCGGYECNNGIFELTWGMIHSDYHMMTYGTHLLFLRLNLIRAEFENALVRIETTQKAEGFFNKHGFRAVAITIDGFGDGLDKVEMEVKL